MVKQKKASVVLSGPTGEPHPPTFDNTTFDEYAGLYEQLAQWPYRKYLEIPALAACLGDLTGQTVLDFGCGPGFFSRWLKQRGAQAVVGHDISAGMLNYARRREEKERQGIIYLAELDETYTAAFDIVLAIYVLPYAPDHEALRALCRSMARVLKPGGRLITLPLHPDFHPDAEYYRAYGFRLIEPAPRRDGGKVRLHLCQPPYDINLDAYYWSAETLAAALADAGFINLRWPGLTLPAGPAPTPPGGFEFLLPYFLRPHVAIIECVKEG